MYPSPILSLNSLCAISLTRFLIDISSAADNTILKNRAQNIECSFGCLARSTVLLKPNVANILLFNFSEQTFVQHGPITIAIDCNGLSFLIFEEKWPIYGPGSIPNSDSFWVRRLFNVCVLVFCAPNATILLDYIPAKIKMSFFCKDVFFSKFASSVSRLQVHLAHNDGQLASTPEPIERCMAS